MSSEKKPPTGGGRVGLSDDANRDRLNGADEYVVFSSSSATDRKSAPVEESFPAINVMIVDDEQDVLDLTHMVLRDYSFEGRRINLIDANSAAEAKEKVSQYDDIALIMLDVVMESDDAGLNLVQYIREALRNNMVRIILRTGQPGTAPEKEIIANYDINDYKSKTELTAQKLHTAVTSSLRNFRDLQIIEKQHTEIEEKNRLNEQLLDALPCSAMLLKRDGEVIVCNSVAKNQGITPGVNCIAESAEANPCPWGPLVSEVNRDSKQHWEKKVNSTFFDIYWMPLLNDLSLYYAFDITQRKKEEEDRKQVQRLFQQAQKMETVGMLASGIAHDFNNALSGVVGAAQLLEMTVPAGSQEAKLTSAIITAGKTGTHLAGRLLSLSRQSEEEFELVDLHTVLTDTVHLLSSGSRKVTIKTELTAERTRLLGDVNQLQNAFINLGVNARDAMPAGGKLIYATRMQTMTEADINKYPQELGPGDYISVNVTDTGGGIPAELLDRIFEPLFTTKEPGKGTGLGLASVYSCVQSHKGIISVDSTVDKGTTFSILLPLEG
ncbi:MAG: response regulator [Deltaproteobacteria bacterium]|nr:response regulator [Deltaproteobacteria bacterium]